MSYAWKTLFVQRAGRKGRWPGPRGPGRGRPAGWTRSRTRQWVPRASDLCRKNACWTVPGGEPWAGLGQPPGWSGLATELSQGVRSQAGGPGVGPELAVAGDGGVQARFAHLLLCLVGDHGHPCTQTQRLRLGMVTSPSGVIHLTFPLCVLFLERVSVLWCSCPSGHIQRTSQKPAGVAGHSVVSARSLGG